MKRLFMVRTDTGKYVSESGFTEQFMTPDGPAKKFVTRFKYFENKADAKAERDLMIEITGKPHFVARGPDHMGPHGNHNPQRRNKHETS